jgi:DNA-binding CsgD family transcriptional regulator
MKKSPVSTPMLSELQLNILRLLSSGQSSREIADTLGYKDGTIRVYLHNLYREIDVLNRTQAVRWWLDFSGQTKPTGAPSDAVDIDAHKSFGERALAQGLLQPLGMLEMYLGPYSRAWELANMLEADEERMTSQYAPQVRALWTAFLDSDFAEAKRLFDRGYLQKFYVDAPSDAALLATMLVVGGFTSRARRGLDAITASKASPLSAAEQALINGIWAASETGKPGGFSATHEQLSTTGRLGMVFKHLGLVALFHLYRGYGDTVRARAIAECILCEAETQREQLRALGDQSSAGANTLPKPPSTTLALTLGELAKVAG